MIKKWIEPQSRWVIRTLFQRDFDAFAETAQRNVNIAMVLWDGIIAYFVLNWLF